MAKTKVFVSFDYKHDKNIKDALIEQSKYADSPFSISDYSITRQIDQKWKVEARRRISECDLMIVLCGEFTHQSNGVAAEISIAQEENKKYYLIKGRKKKTVSKPLNAKVSDKIYKWKWDILKDIITKSSSSE